MSSLNLVHYCLDSGVHFIFLVSGVIFDYTIDTTNNTSDLYYYNTENSVHFKDGWDFDKIANKSLERRNAILLPNIASPKFNYSILQINENAGIMTVVGDVSKGIYSYQTPTSEDDAKSETAPKQYFGIIYGQLLKTKINGKPVVFYDKTGANSFADNDSIRDGVCEVCHTTTKHFRNDGTGEDQEHFGESGTSKAGTNCVECHRHEMGFHHSNNGGSEVCTECHNSNKHLQHLNAGEQCANCHDLKNMWDGEGEGRTIISPLHRIDSETNESICKKCHYNPTTDGDPNDEDYINHWEDSNYTIGCSGCHNGRPTELDPNNEDKKFRLVWNDSSQAYYNESLVMSSGGHNRLVGPNSKRHYPCSKCHFLSIKISDDKTTWSFKRKHTNGPTIDVDIDPAEAIIGSAKLPEYNKGIGALGPKSCVELYCHSDGTKKDPKVRPYSWDGGPKGCNSCHGHDRRSDCTKCHTDGRSFDNDNMWLAAMPMYDNEGAGADKANSHVNHILNEKKSCDACHADTVQGDTCNKNGCHGTNQSGPMSDSGHTNPVFHVNHKKTVTFKDGGKYDLDTKTCTETNCHGSQAMIWGSTGDGKKACYGCHVSTSGNDTDDYLKNGIRAYIDLTDWQTSGHGRAAKDGPYPSSGNPAANFNDSLNECWYCHDPAVSHASDNFSTNPFRLRLHQSYSKRFEKECLYCHNTATTSECLSCHDDGASKSYSPQIGIPTTNDTEGLVLFKNDTNRQKHAAYRDDLAQSCVTISCHAKDETRHKIGSNDSWNDSQKADVRNQYVMMGVCLQCHDDDSGEQCQSCHAYGDNDSRYQRGFDPQMPGSRRITPKQAKASSAHFGYKHWERHQEEGTWKGGKFCWDCHDPHGDKNIYMIHDKVTLTSEGKFGQPTFTNDSGIITYNQAEVVFTKKDSGKDYAKSTSANPNEVVIFNGICQVCHTNPTDELDPKKVAAHYTSTSGDGHNSSLICTSCHEHRFTSSHASDKKCNTCHRSKPIPRHTAFGLPRDCTKCHRGIRLRIDIMGQFRGNSHHVQRPDGTIKNTDCYPCHWEATAEGLINVKHHEGYNYKNHTFINNERVDLVIMGPNGKRPLEGNESRPTEYLYNESNIAAGTASIFYANTIGTNDERTNIERITPHCLSCHSDQNNELSPAFPEGFFGDYNTPRQYAWDATSIAARYLNKGTSVFGKYTDFPNAAPKNITKAFSAHGNAINNAGGYNDTSGVDGLIPNTRAGSRNVQCFDCHSSHGSKVSGVTSAYMDYKGGYNGGNLKETKGGEGGYPKTYIASKNMDNESVNPYNDQAGQCFDCHETETANNSSGPKAKPWGYSSTFGASKPIVGYKDNNQFKGTSKSKYTYKKNNDNRTTVGGHLRRSSDLLGLNDSPTSSIRHTVQGVINGICTPCHDPHGVSPSLGAEYMPYAVPLLKGTWLTSPYKEDGANPYIPAAGYINPSNQRLPDIGSGDGGDKESYNPPLYKKKNVHIDRYTFNTGKIKVIYESEDKFAGLCLTCHPKNSLTDGINKNRAWRSLDRIHESVKNWGNDDGQSIQGWVDGTNWRTSWQTVEGWTANGEHNYPCSKCHQPHASGLPRLMTTNCLDAKHRGQVVSGGKPFFTNNQHSNSHGKWPNSDYLNDSMENNMGGRFPSEVKTQTGEIWGRQRLYGCHETPLANNNESEWEDQRWNMKTLWPNDSFNHGNDRRSY